MLRRLLRLRAGGRASARGREPWRRSCVPGNGWVAAAAAPCASPACLPAGRARPAPPFPMLVPEPGSQGRSSRWVSLPTPDLSVSSLSIAPVAAMGGREATEGCSQSGLRRFPQDSEPLHSSPERERGKEARN
ncbi:hypothetical protein AB1E18_018504 [Capra hircus]